MDPVYPPPRNPRSYLFTVRVWREELGAGTDEARMQVRHLLSGETRFCRAWTELVAFMQAQMEAPDADGDSAPSSTS